MPGEPIGVPRLTRTREWCNGSHARLRIWCLRAWGFDSPLPHSNDPRAGDRSCTIEHLAPADAGEGVFATAVERSAVGRGAIYDVAATRDADGQLLAELRGHSRQLAARRGFSA